MTDLNIRRCSGLVVDIHTHTFPDRIAAKALASLQGRCHTALFSDGTAAGLTAARIRAGIDIAVVQPVATDPSQVEHINDSVIRTNAGSGRTGLVSFGAMHPAYAGWEKELDRIAAAGVRGIKMHPPYIQIGIDDPRMIPVLRRCRDLGLAVLIHSGWDIGLPGAEEALPSRICSMLDAVGGLTLIAGHMGGWRCWEESARLLAGSGVYIDTAFSLGTLVPARDGYPWNERDLAMLSPAEFCDLVRAYGADHVLFGTDSPWTEPAAELAAVRALPLSPEDLALICGENAARLLHL